MGMPQWTCQSFFVSQGALQAASAWNSEPVLNSRACSLGREGGLSKSHSDPKGVQSTLLEFGTGSEFPAGALYRAPWNADSTWNRFCSASWANDSRNCVTGIQMHFMGAQLFTSVLMTRASLPAKHNKAIDN